MPKLKWLTYFKRTEKNNRKLLTIYETYHIHL